MKQKKLFVHCQKKTQQAKGNERKAKCRHKHLKSNQWRLNNFSV